MATANRYMGSTATTTTVVQADGMLSLPPELRNRLNELLRNNARLVLTATPGFAENVVSPVIRELETAAHDAAEISDQAMRHRNMEWLHQIQQRQADAVHHFTDRLEAHFDTLSTADQTRVLPFIEQITEFFEEFFNYLTLETQQVFEYAKQGHKIDKKAAKEHFGKALATMKKIFEDALQQARQQAAAAVTPI